MPIVGNSNQRQLLPRFFSFARSPLYLPRFFGRARLIFYLSGLFRGFRRRLFFFLQERTIRSKFCHGGDPLFLPSRACLSFSPALARFLRFCLHYGHGGWWKSARNQWCAHPYGTASTRISTSSPRWNYWRRIHQSDAGRHYHSGSNRYQVLIRTRPSR